MTSFKIANEILPTTRGTSSFGNDVNGDENEE